ncbi:hypothetical protein TNCV_5063651 [Trichonephila clavipes]|nr:hypothetical protein TNCV_5063651 [Trichonephila clavipes]
MCSDIEYLSPDGLLTLKNQLLWLGPRQRVPYADPCFFQSETIGGVKEDHTGGLKRRGRNHFRGSGLSPYIYNGELSSKAVKRRQWAEGTRPSEHVSDTCWFVKKPGGKKRKKREEENERKKKEKSSEKTGAGRFRKRRGEFQSFLIRDADQESKTRMRNNALRTGPRQAVE